MEEQRKFPNFRELFTELYLDDVGGEKNLSFSGSLMKLGTLRSYQHGRGLTRK